MLYLIVVPQSPTLGPKPAKGNSFRARTYKDQYIRVASQTIKVDVIESRTWLLGFPVISHFRKVVGSKFKCNGSGCMVAMNITIWRGIDRCTSGLLTPLQPPPPPPPPPQHLLLCARSPAAQRPRDLTLADFNLWLERRLCLTLLLLLESQPAPPPRVRPPALPARLGRQIPCAV